MPFHEHETYSFDNARVAQAMKLARAAIGCNQGDFAELLGVSKATIARIETLEMAGRFEIYARMVELLRDYDVFIDAVSSEGVQVEVGPNAVAALIVRLEDDANRRSDRNTGKHAR